MANSTIAAAVAAALHQIDVKTFHDTLMISEASELPDAQKESFERMKMILFFATEFQKAFPNPKP